MGTKMKSVGLLLIVFFSASFYSDSPRSEVVKMPVTDFTIEIERLKNQGESSKNEFLIINKNIDSLLCKSYEKF